MTRRRATPTDDRPRCRGCREPFTPSVSNEFCRICDDRRERALTEAQDLRQDLEDARRRLGCLESRLGGDVALSPDRALERALADVQALSARIADLDGTIAGLRRGLVQRDEDIARLTRELKTAALRAALLELGGSPEPAPIPPDILRLLIQLAHPDRNDNNEAATKATAWLLKQRSST